MLELPLCGYMHACTREKRHTLLGRNVSLLIDGKPQGCPCFLQHFLDCCSRLSLQFQQGLSNDRGRALGCLTSQSRSNVRDLPLVQDRYISLSVCSSAMSIQILLREKYRMFCPKHKTNGAFSSVRLLIRSFVPSETQRLVNVSGGGAARYFDRFDDKEFCRRKVRCFE